MTKEEFLKEAITKGPGLDGYAYRADVYCVECGEKIIRGLVESCGDEIPILSPDSEDIPQPIFFGEADTRQYCKECETYLYGDDPYDPWEYDFDED